jgi:hypothetical protein
MQQFLIYALLDPITKEVRYIGQTTDIKTRLASHFRLSQLKDITRKNGWIKSLLKKGLLPDYQIICECSSKEELNEKEIYYISLFRESGKLTNHSDGGNFGPSGKGKSVISKNMYTGEIKEYQHSSDVRRDGFNYKVVWAVCKGQKKSSNNHLWCFKGEEFKTHDFLIYKEKILPASLMAKEYNIPGYILRYRIRSGWSIEEAIETPISTGNGTMRRVKLQTKRNAA